MREIECGAIADAVERLCIEANYCLPGDVKARFAEAVTTEKSPLGRNVLETLIENAETAARDGYPMCQDTGVLVAFVEIGQDARITGGWIEDAINEGVRRGYEKGFLRKSVVADPIRRENTGDNTPAVIYYEIVPGDGLKITVAPKGFGSENMSALRMLTPSDGLEAVKNFVTETAVNVGPNACPPVILGVGLGGTMEKAALLAKKALLRSVDERHPDPFWAGVEAELCGRINKTGIGPGGLGGTTTCLGVSIEVYPTHIAGLPVAVNISCHAARHAAARL